MRVLYDITTLGAIHSAPGVQGAGIFRATESMGMALERTDGTELFLSSAPTQYRNTIRYLVDTQRFELDRFAVPSLGADDFSGCALTSPQADLFFEGDVPGCATRHAHRKRRRLACPQPDLRPIGDGETTSLRRHLTTS